jgi:glycosyltransferase involved in cell wall biosynthesis
MKVLHVPFAYFPDACGGTEVYVQSLCRELTHLGVTSVIAAPGLHFGDSEHEGIRVHRLGVQAETSVLMMHGATGDPVAARAFGEVLDLERPDVVHFHAFSPAISVQCVAAAKQRGLRCVYTYHTSTITCGRSTLLRWGTIPCDGEMIASAALPVRSRGTA